MSKEHGLMLIDRWLKDYEADQLLAEWEAMTQDLRGDLEAVAEDVNDLGRKVDSLDDDMSSLALHSEDLEGRVSDLEGWQEESA